MHQSGEVQCKLRGACALINGKTCCQYLTRIVLDSCAAGLWLKWLQNGKHLCSGDSALRLMWYCVVVYIMLCCSTLIHIYIYILHLCYITFYIVHNIICDTIFHLIALCCWSDFGISISISHNNHHPHHLTMAGRIPLTLEFACMLPWLWSKPC